jgi:hypothetical protein
LFAITKYHWPICWTIWFIPFVRLTFPYWFWERVIPYTYFRLWVHGGCDRSAEDVYIILHGIWPYLPICCGLRCLTLNFVLGFWVMITFHTLLTFSHSKIYATITKISCRQSICKLIKNNVSTRTIFCLKVILKGLYEHAGRFFNLSYKWRNVFQANVLRFTFKKPNRGCLLLLGTWSHHWYIQGSVLAHLFLWFVIPTCVLRLITFWYLCHFSKVFFSLKTMEN